MTRRLHDIPRRAILAGDALVQLQRMPTASVDAVITSPPYYALRDYGTDGQIGLEASIEEWVANLREVMREIARALKPTGSVWLNLGDSYSRHPRYGAPPKSLLLGPERLALALVADGWTIRNKVIWAKTRAMPSSARDRLACTWEVVYLLTRSRRYHLDLDVIRQPHRSRPLPTKGSFYPPASAVPPRWAGPLAGNNSGLAKLKAAGIAGHPLGGTPRDVWSLPSANFRGEHFATFPKALIERPILASVPERVCPRCGLPWERGPARTVGHMAVLGELRPSCRCRKGWVPGVVLDPFFGAGTVGLVAEEHGLDWVGVELNPDFVDLATARIRSARKGGGGERKEERMNEGQPQGTNANASEHEPELQPRIYVASLSDYNAGRLHGRWIDASGSVEELNDAINEMLAAPPEPGAEEWAIHDYEGFGPLRLDEYESIEHVSQIARGIAEHGPAFAAWASILSSGEEDELERFEECFLGKWDSLTDFAEQYVDETGIEDAVDKAAGSLAPYVRIDAEALGRDMELGGYLSSVEAPDGGVFLFGQ